MSSQVTCEHRLNVRWLGCDGDANTGKDDESEVNVAATVHFLTVCCPKVIKGLLMINNYFHAQSTDIFLATFMKCGTTWLLLQKYTINKVMK
uniref:Sulfotransferase n=1 Tax=Lactuca sativa TaxID=4236 RepID=A0A9R1XHB9_LACSA|nr:hypothetical protein LSAT_V11C400201230 [Lactuca sativa]